MFVVHALILTFMTTPLVLLFYPAKYRVHQHSDRKRGGGETATGAKHLTNDGGKTKFALILDKIESLPAAMTLSQLLNSPLASSPLSSQRSSVDEKAVNTVNTRTAPPITIEALRLIELSSRTSAVLRSQEAESLLYNDPVISVYKTFGQLNRFNVSANLSVIDQDQFPDAVAKHVAETGSQMTIIPWPRGVTSILEEHQDQKVGARNPFDGVFHKTTTVDQTSSVIFSEFIRNVFAKSPSDVALFVDRGMSNGSVTTSHQHLFLPFFGGPDDRLALTFLVQLCENPLVTATVVRIVAKDKDADNLKVTTPTNTALSPTYQNVSIIILFPPLQRYYHFSQTAAAADTIYGQSDTQTRLESDTADNLTWEQFANPTTANSSSRMTFHTETIATPLGRAIELAMAEAAIGRSSSSNKTMIVLAGRSRRMAVESLHAELRNMIIESGSSISTSVPKTLGDVGAALVASGVDASLLILQAAPRLD